MGYDWMVDVDQEPDFIGKEALRRVKREGVSRRMVGLEIGGDRLGSFNDGSMIESFTVLDGEMPVGEVTSACFSPRLERNIGLAMVPVPLSEIGTDVQVATSAGIVPATVVPKPFIDPTKERPKQSMRSDEAAAS